MAPPWALPAQFYYRCRPGSSKSRPHQIALLPIGILILARGTQKKNHFPVSKKTFREPFLCASSSELGHLLSQRAPFFFGLQHSANGPHHERAVKSSHTKVLPLTLASGHGRYITVTAQYRYTRTDTCVRFRWGMAVTYNLYAGYKFITGSLPKRLRDGRFTFETKALDIIVFQGGDDGRGYRNMCKIPQGSNSNQGD
jgi:hypothetical protein